jgi:putative oxygen-independent coproporphyrinogen III oxidase
MLKLPPISLYIHIPWCQRKCPYCDFNSHEHRGELPQRAYIDALLADFKLDMPLLQGRPLHSIFIGGGTPSLFDASSFAALFTGLQQMVEFSSQIEITLEANPGTAEAEKFAAFRHAGINRLSLGIQSFEDKKLQALGRIHDGRQSGRAIDIARAAGFDNLNLDLMYGLPEQTRQQALTDLDTAIGMQSEHLSWYELTIEPNTRFYNTPPLLPEEDHIIIVQEQGLKLISASGLQRYEVSAYAGKGKQARHNINYWEFGDYLGIGAGAHGKITLAQEQRIVRNRKIKQPNHYLRQDISYTAARDTVSASELVLEFLMNAFRLTGGFTAPLFEERTGLAFSTIRKRIEYLVSAGLLSMQHDRISPTQTGQLLINNLLEEFL